jgi:hypothetical protein
MEHDHQMRLEHYRESLRMLQLAAPGHALVQRLARELESCAIAIGRGAGGDHEGRVPRGQADRPAPS